MYNKIFTKILDSSIWLEDNATRIVWLTLLAAMDEDGFCQFASVANLAHRARVTLDEAKAATACLEGPDENSSDPDNEGRRLERVAGGWIVLNAPKYRELVTRTVVKEQTRARVTKFREKKRMCNGDVTQSEASSDSATTSEAEASIPKEKSKGITEGSTRSLIPTTEQSKRIASLFNRRLTTAWSEKEFAAYRKIGTVEPDQLTAIEGYYAAERAKGDEGRHRRDLQTFLNNFPGELDRALAWAATRKNGVPRGTSSVTTEHPNWASWLKSKGQEYIEMSRAMPYVREEFYKAQK